MNGPGPRDGELPLVSAMLSASDLALVAADADGVIRMFNAGAERALGATAGDVVGHRRMTDFLEPRQLELRTREFEQKHGRPPAGPPEWELLIETNATGNTRPWAVVRTDGSATPMVMSFSLLRAADTTVCGVLGIGQDVSAFVRDGAMLRAANESLRERVAARTAALWETEARLRLSEVTVEQAPVATFWLNSQGRAVRYNAEALRLMGADPEQVAGRRVPEVMTDPSGATWEQRWVELKREGRLELSLSLRTMDGRAIPIAVEAAFLDFEGEELALVFVRDVHVQKDAERALLAKEAELQAALADAERTRDLFESLATRAPTSVFLLDRSSGATFFNDQLERMLDVPRSDLEGFRWESLVHPDDRAALRATGRRVFEGGETTQVELRFVRPDGSVRWAVVRSAPLYAGDGTIRSAVGTVTETTQRKRLEHALFCVATELSTPTGDPSAMYRTAAARIVELLSVEIALIAVVHGDQARTLAVCIDGKTEENFEYSLAGTPCGDVMQGSLKLVPRNLRALFPDDEIAAGLAAESYAGLCLRDSSGEAMGLLAVISRREMPDPEAMTPALHVFASRIAAEIERERSEANYRDLFEFSPDAIIMSDRGGSIVLANRAAEAMVGYTREELIGKPIEILLPKELRPAHVRMRELYVETTQPRPMSERSSVFTMRRKDGVEMPVEISLGPLATPRGTIIAAAIRDVTERRRAEQAQARFAADLARQVEERTASLAAANRELDAFAASVSHDLRAPLRRIHGFTSLLVDQLGSRMTPAEAASAQAIGESASEMSVLIGALLDAARSARTAMHHERLDVAEIANKVMAELSADCRERQIRFEAGPVPTVLGDRILIEQVLRNLLSNALKYSRPRSPARIAVGFEGLEAGRAVVYVRDNGVGFKAEASSRLFGMFQRLHDPQEFEGTGVGLANVKRIVERHGGRVWAESVRDGGATFRFTLALAGSGEEERAD